MNEPPQTCDHAKVAEALRELPQPSFSFAADEVALAALQAREEPTRCDICSEQIDQPTSSGLLMWVRGGERRYEEPPLCLVCSGMLDVTTFAQMRCAEETD